jgi:hypothetical protein
MTPLSLDGAEQDSSRPSCLNDNIEKVTHFLNSLVVQAMSLMNAIKQQKLASFENRPQWNWKQFLVIKSG